MKDTDQFLRLFMEALDIEGREIKLSDQFRMLNEWDSLSRLSLIALIDETYGVQISDSDFNRLITVEDVYKVITKNKS